MFCHADMRTSTARPMVRMCRHIYTMVRSWSSPAAARLQGCITAARQHCCHTEVRSPGASRWWTRKHLPNRIDPSVTDGERPNRRRWQASPCGGLFQRLAVRLNDVEAVSCSGRRSCHIPPAALRRHVAVRRAFFHHRGSAFHPEKVDGVLAVELMLHGHVNFMNCMATRLLLESNLFTMCDVCAVA